ncbi:MAG: ATP synthase F1 subunit delta [Candidatus Aminicenantes bacterium]
MKNQVLIRRYTQGLVNSIQDQKEYQTLSQRLIEFQNFLSEQKNLQQALLSPFLPTFRKMKIAKEVLTKLSLPDKIRRFISLLVENNRLELFPQILELLPELWNEKKGISTIQVSSAVSLSQSQKKRLKEKLELLEKGPVSLKYNIDLGLIAGLSLRKKNIVYDLSIKGGLEDIKEKMSEEPG